MIILMSAWELKCDLKKEKEEGKSNKLKYFLQKLLLT